MQRKSLNPQEDPLTQGEELTSQEEIQIAKEKLERDLEEARKKEETRINDEKAAAEAKRLLKEQEDRKKSAEHKKEEVQKKEMKSEQSVPPIPPVTSTPPLNISDMYRNSQLQVEALTVQLNELKKHAHEEEEAHKEIENLLRQLNASRENAMAMDTQHKKDMLNLKEEHKKQLHQIEEEVKKQTQDLEQSYINKLNEMKQQYDDREANLKKDYENALADLNQDISERDANPIAGLQYEIDQLAIKSDESVQSKAFIQSLKDLEKDLSADITKRLNHINKKTGGHPKISDFAQLNKCTANQLARLTEILLRDLRAMPLPRQTSDMSNEEYTQLLQEHRKARIGRIRMYEDACKETPGWEKFLKVVGACIVGAVAVAACVAIGVTAVALAACGGPGGFVTAALLLAGGNYLGATVGISAAALVTGVVTAAGTGFGLFQPHGLRKTAVDTGRTMENYEKYVISTVTPTKMKV